MSAAIYVIWVQEFSVNGICAGCACADMLALAAFTSAWFLAGTVTTGMTKFAIGIKLARQMIPAREIPRLRRSEIRFAVPCAGLLADYEPSRQYLSQIEQSRQLPAHNRSR